MSKNAKRRLIVLSAIMVICLFVVIFSTIFDEKMEPVAYNYYVENAAEESGMPNAVTAIYLRYRIFDTLFEALLLGAAVSVVFYFAAPWEKEIEKKGGDENV
ncbi:MAG: hypothetical protein JXN10_08985 [Clostridia bacterium]|nr:hypothetical protein [Clostridia bacterium]MBN2883653.1 hypothetical protein [Clostridia bacterium]